MVNHTEVSRLSKGADPHGGGLHNISGRVECEADPPAAGSTAGDQVSL